MDQPTDSGRRGGAIDDPDIDQRDAKDERFRAAARPDAIGDPDPESADEDSQDLHDLDRLGGTGAPD